MKQSALLAVLICCANCVTAAATPTPFGFDGQAPVAAALDHPRWSKMAQQHDQERAEFEACLQQHSDCAPHLLDYRRTLARAARLNPQAQLALIDHFVNTQQTPAASNADDDQWHTLSHFLKVGGSAEDFAIAKYYALRELGFDTHKMRILVAYANNASSPHALLAVELNGHSHVLASDKKNASATDQQAEYAATYAINEHHWWSYAPTDVADRFVKSL